MASILFSSLKEIYLHIILESTERMKLNLNYLNARTGGNGGGERFFFLNKNFLHEIYNPKDMVNVT